MKIFTSFFFYVTTLLFFSLFSSPSQSLYRETHQLINFKNVLPDKNLLPDWSSSKNPCTFDGVTCRDNKVTSIDLSSKPLNVGFSAVAPFIMSFTGLESLFLSNSHINGSIAAFNFKCSASLTNLDLSRNSLSGPVTSLGSCSSLKYLNVSSNTFYFPRKVSGGLKKLNRLEVLDLSSNSLSGIVPPSLGSCSLLKSLVLSSNNFSGTLPIDTLLKMRGLKVLDLSFNEFSGKLPESLTNLSASLLTLDLSSNYFSGLILPNLCWNPKNTLQELHLQNNLFTGKIPPTLSNCSELVSLHLSFNYLSGTIPSSLGSLLKLRDVKLWMNMLEGEIPQELMYVKTLETLILDFNYLTGEIPFGLSNCTKLIWVSLSNNWLTGQIPSWIGRLENLAILDLSNNTLHGNIPAELGDCKSLVWLDLNTNSFDGTISSEMFKQSGRIAANLMAGKRYVYIKNDGMKKQCHGAGKLLEFQGIRPEHLNRVSTRNPCNFTRVYGGHTSPSFDYDGSMMFLDMSYNMLSGYIPKEIGSMGYLFVLNLGHNFISGSIPDEVGDLRGLNILDLSSNKLDGSIPLAMSALTMLTEIDLSNNNLSGQIPEVGQFETFPREKFLNNSGLCGYPLPRCDPVNANGYAELPKQEEEEEGELLSWKAVAIGYALGVLFGLAIAQVAASYKPEWFFKNFGLRKSRNR
ncbi:PREDICTED: protein BRASSINOSTEROID INSENSITIVE 1-like [Camelina sativa]|uniref:non-specific serine/threonine protein kinase n=1 Tax=Camelina sativa TaxID=90675 RepID=A0ABM0ZGF2_CAMSA|nr:PREDICTED: protein BRASSINOSTEROID INSENSITIVE 1-like [Camelina sativa]